MQQAGGLKFGEKLRKTVKYPDRGSKLDSKSTNKMETKAESH